MMGNGLERAPVDLDEHFHFRVIIELSSSWILSAEAATAAKPALERRLKRREDQIENEIMERPSLERERSRDDWSSGRR